MARHSQQPTQPRFVCSSCYKKDCSKCIDKARLKLIKHGYIDEESKRICMCHNKTHNAQIAEG